MIIVHIIHIIILIIIYNLENICFIFETIINKWNTNVRTYLSDFGMRTSWYQYTIPPRPFTSIRWVHSSSRPSSFTILTHSCFCPNAFIFLFFFCRRQYLLYETRHYELLYKHVYYRGKYVITLMAYGHHRDNLSTRNPLAEKPRPVLLVIRISQGNSNLRALRLLLRSCSTHKVSNFVLFDKICLMNYLLF